MCHSAWNLPHWAQKAKGWRRRGEEKLAGATRATQESVPVWNWGVHGLGDQMLSSRGWSGLAPREAAHGPHQTGRGHRGHPGMSHRPHPSPRHMPTEQSLGRQGLSHVTGPQG